MTALADNPAHTLFAYSRLKHDNKSKDTTDVRW